MSPVDKDIGRLIRKAREHLKLTVEDVAEELGISADRLLRIEFGEFRPTPYQLLSLCAVLRVQPSWFFPEVWNPGDSSPNDLLGDEEREEVATATTATVESPRGPSREFIELSFPGGIRVLLSRDFDETIFRKIVDILKES